MIELQEYGTSNRVPRSNNNILVITPMVSGTDEIMKNGFEFAW